MVHHLTYDTTLTCAYGGLQGYEAVHSGMWLTVSTLI